jgi:hypothetical protein
MKKNMMRLRLPSRRRLIEGEQKSPISEDDGMTKFLQRHTNAPIKIRDKSKGQMLAQAIASLHGLF